MKKWVLVSLIVFAAATNAHDYSFLIDDSTRGVRMELHRHIVDRSAEHPYYACRILVPMLLDPLIDLAARFMPREDAFGRVYAVYHLFALSFLLWTAFQYLAVWFGADRALAGTLLIAATLRIALRHHDYQPWSLLEPSLITMALLWMLRRRHLALAVLVLVASLNRETAVFIVLLYFVVRVRDRQSALWGAAYAAIWLSIYVGLQWFVAATPTPPPLEEIWRMNTRREQLGLTAVNVALLFGPLLPFAALGYTHAPEFVRRSAIVIGPYLATIALYGLWWEVRLLMPLYPLVVPLALSYVFRSPAPELPTRSADRSGRAPDPRPPSS